VKYWISYRLPDGKQKREYVGSFKDLNGYSIEDAKKVQGKRLVQKAENRLLDIKQDSKMTFKELSEWYLGLEKVKALASYATVKSYLKKFNIEFGNRLVADVRLAELENRQEKRRKEGFKPKTIDDELNYVKTMVIKAFYNDIVSGEVLKTFQRVRHVLKKNANRRDRVLTKGEYERLLCAGQKHLREILLTAYWTGMRRGEIINLTWDKVDLKTRVICLEASDTKESKPKRVPIGTEFHALLERIPRALHDAHVFLREGKQIGRYYTALTQASEKAGITCGQKVKGGFTFHDLRHTFITDMRRAGVPRTVIMSITGHAPKDMNDRYDSVNDQDRLNGISYLEAYRRNVDQTVDQKHADKS
jgi:integrase